MGRLIACPNCQALQDELAASLVLLVVAALFVRSLSAIQTMDFGFNPNHVMNFTVDANEIGMASA